MKELLSYFTDLDKQEPIPTILSVEMNKILASLKTGKVAEPDRIENATFRAFAPTLSHYLSKIFNPMLKSGESPEQWQVSEIILLHK